MKILIAEIQWPPETFIGNLIRGLAHEGFEITVVSKTKFQKQERIKWMHPSLLKLCNPKKWDLIYFPWNSSAIQYMPLMDSGVPAIVSCRGAQVNIAPHNPERKTGPGLRRTFQKAARVHCVSEAILKEAVMHGLDEKKAVIINPAVDADFFTPGEKRGKNGVFKIISTGSLIWRKGYEYALMAVKSLIDANLAVSYTIAGDGPEKQRVLYTIEDLNLQEHVSLAGKIPPEKVREYLRASDVFLLSSLSEGISNAVLEAMACGLPVVTTDSGGMREAVTDGVEGFVVPVRDPESMAGRIKTLASGPSKMKHFEEAARKKVMERFRLDRQIKQFAEMFESAC